MFDWSKDDLSTLHEIAHETGLSPELRNFAEYCRQEAGNHETDAFENLRIFLTETEQWDYRDKRSFVDWLLRIQHNHPNLHNVIHATLYHELVEPVMRRWRDEAPDDPALLRWSDKMEDLEQARKLAPDDPIITRRLIDMLVKRIKQDCGHLPDEYPGHPETDRAMLAEEIALLEGLKNRTRHDERLLAEARDLQQQLAALTQGGNVTVIDVEIPEEDL